jgi:hypothetical protein
MTGFEIGAAIVVIALAIGIAVGILIVIALPQIRYYRNARRYLDRGGWEELPPPPPGDAKPPWWQDG